MTSSTKLELRFRLVGVAVSLMLLMGGLVIGQHPNYRPFKKITKPDAKSGDRFGQTVTIVGNTIAIAAREDDTFRTNGGAVYLYNLRGEHLRTIGSPNASSGGFFGEYMTSVGDDKILISARFESNAAGRAYLFHKDGDLLHTFESPSPAVGADFGGRVVLSVGDRIIIASTKDHSLGDNGGAVFIFSLDGELLHTVVSPSPDVDGCLGRNGTLVGNDRMLISDACDSFSGVQQAGAVFLYDLEGEFLEVFDNPMPERLDGFGTGVAYAGDRVLIGGVQIDDEVTDASTGAAYIFELDGTLITRISDPEPIPGNWFGWNAASFNDELFIVGSIFNSSGEHRAGKAFLVNLEGEIVETLSSPESGGQQFGSSFANIGDVLLVGEPASDGGYPNGLGAVWMFAPEGLGDFNTSGSYDLKDVDQLCAAVALGNSTAPVDLTGDERVNADDLSLFLEVSEILPGDVDANGLVSFADFLTLSANFGQSGNWSHGDLDCDGQITFPDFLIMSDNFGATNAAANVPEPCFAVPSLLIMLSGTIAACRRFHTRIKLRPVVSRHRS